MKEKSGEILDRSKRWKVKRRIKINPRERKVEENVWKKLNVEEDDFNVRKLRRKLKRNVS